LYVEFPVDHEPCGGLTLELAAAVVGGQPAVDLARLVGTLDALVEVVAVSVVALGESGGDEPADSSARVDPHAATPLPRLDL
jgi:hypothetical protein